MCYIGTKIKQEKNWRGAWKNKGTTESVSGKYSELTIEAAIPHYIQYPINTPAKLIINNTLKFNTISGKTATFAGTILSGSDTATISVENGTVSGYVFPEGYTNGTGTSGVWYELVISDMYSKAMLGRTLGETELSGKYNSNYSKNGDVINQSWKR